MTGANGAAVYCESASIKRAYFSRGTTECGIDQAISSDRAPVELPWESTSTPACAETGAPGKPCGITVSATLVSVTPTTCTNLRDPHMRNGGVGRNRPISPRIRGRLSRFFAWPSIQNLFKVHSTSRAFHLSGLRGGVASGMLALSLVGSLGADVHDSAPRSGAFSTDCGQLRS